MEIGLWVIIWLGLLGIFVTYLGRKTDLRVTKDSASKRRMFWFKGVKPNPLNPVSKTALEILMNSFQLESAKPSNPKASTVAVANLPALKPATEEPVTVTKDHVTVAANSLARKPATNGKDISRPLKPLQSLKTPLLAPAKKTLTAPKDRPNDRPKDRPNDWAVLQNQAAELVAQAQYTECLQKFQRHSKFPPSAVQPPTSGFLWYYKGLCEVKTGQAGLAKASFQNCFQQHWVNKDAQWLEHLKLVITAFQQVEEYQQAVFFCHLELDFQQSKSNWQAVHKVYAKMIQLYEQLGQKNLLIEVLENQQQLYTKQGDHQAQIELLDKLGKAYFDQGNQQKSKLCYQKSFELKNKT